MSSPHNKWSPDIVKYKLSANKSGCASNKSINHDVCLKRVQQNRYFFVKVQKVRASTKTFYVSQIFGWRFSIRCANAANISTNIWLFDQHLKYCKNTHIMSLLSKKTWNIDDKLFK